MATIIARKDTPNHPFNISELDFSQDLFVEPIAGQWFRLGAWTIATHRDERGVEDVIFRQSLLLPPGGFPEIFDHLEYIGNVICQLDKPGRLVRYIDGAEEYVYKPFHRFDFNSLAAEPLVFVHSDTTGARLFINPDVWLFFELEEKAPGQGIWWDPRRGVDVLVRRVIDDGNLETIEIRVNYLLKYLQARQMSLIVGHYRHLHLFSPSPNMVEMFVESEDLTLGSPEHGSKAILQNWGLQEDIFGVGPFLQRRLHLWFAIEPAAIDVGDPWIDQPSFDPYTFTLPTHAGAVAPARWKRIRTVEGRTFEGAVCDFMNRVYFRQEVLTKYEAAAGFSVKDDGSVSCHHYWGLERSTARIGNELLATATGDFAEGVPFEEWPHWKQYAVEPPSRETASALRQETIVPEAVNSLVRALERLNEVFTSLAVSLGATIAGPLWRGSLDSLAARQLKWVYPATADDDEFLKRATLASTLFLDGLQTPILRDLLNSAGENLHQSFDKSPKSLGSRNLLQRIALMALLIQDFKPTLAELPMLMQHAESSAKSALKSELEAELKRANTLIRDEFASIAFLYDLRTYGGLAHPPNKEKASAAAASLGLSKGRWHRTDYLRLLNLVTESFRRISEHIDVGARACAASQQMKHHA